MVIFSSYLICYMFPLGTSLSSGLLKLDLQLQNEPLSFSDQLGFYTSDYSSATISLSDYESYASL
jgi:hypothetical protein